MHNKRFEVQHIQTLTLALALTWASFSHPLDPTTGCLMAFWSAMNLGIQLMEQMCTTKLDLARVNLNVASHSTKQRHSGYRRTPSF